MPIEGDGSFLPLQGLGGNAYGEGSGSTPALTGQGYQIVHHPGAALTLPMVEMTFSVAGGGSATAAVLLPALTGAAWVGAQSAILLPGLTVAGTGTVVPQAIGAMTLPMLTMDGTVKVGVVGSAYLTLPKLGVVGRGAGQGALALPSLLVVGNVSTAERSSAAVTLPLLQTSGNVSVFSYPAFGALVLPALIGGPYTNAFLTLPALRMSAQASVLVEAAAFEGWAINIRNNAVTRVTNWPFTRIVQWGDKLMGVAADGLYLIGGVLDAGVPIAWEWRTGLGDLDQPGTKRIPMLYVDGVIDGEIFVVTKDDKGDVRKYRYEANRGRVHMPHRRELGKGVRTRNIALGMSNGPNGAYIEIDGMEPEATVTQRSV